MTVGDHELVVGTVLEATVRNGEAPLLYHQRRFTAGQPIADQTEYFADESGADGFMLARPDGRRRPGR